MREILFRGKTKDGNERVEGFFAAKENKSYIVTVDTIDPVKNHEAFICVEVIPETVGQFTGMTDKNGNRIFEGDIIHSFYANCPKNEHIEKVSFFDGSFAAESARGGCYARIAGQGSPKHFARDKSVYMIECEVIGNIHDNPELLEV